MMLAATRSFRVGEKEFKTPILIPSFSSRGFHDIKKIIKAAEEYITDHALISAFDLHHNLINKRGWTFPELLFLDSGGYEFGIESDLSDHKLRPNTIDSKHWSSEQHKKTIENWEYPCPTVIISYDNPNRRLKIPVQIQRAKKLFATTPNAASEILLKAEEKVNAKKPADGYIKIESIEPVLEELKDFDIIGVTEKELGRTFTDRLFKVYQIRSLLTKHGLNQPLHIFGSLDPISTPLYFLAGADIFDGLTWLRFGYLDGAAVYRHNYAALEIARNMNDSSVNMQIHYRNYNEIMEINTRMKIFLNKSEYKVFQEHKDLFVRCIEELKAQIGD